MILYHTPTSKVTAGVDGKMEELRDDAAKREVPFTQDPKHDSGAEKGPGSLELNCQIVTVYGLGFRV